MGIIITTIEKRTAMTNYQLPIVNEPRSRQTAWRGAQLVIGHWSLVIAVVDGTE
jgi:hypothetical protein